MAKETRESNKNLLKRIDDVMLELNELSGLEETPTPIAILIEIAIGALADIEDMYEVI